MLALHDGRAADGFLELKRQPRPDGAQDVRRAPFLPQQRIAQIMMPQRVDIGHGTTAGGRRHAVLQQMPLDHQHTWRTRTAHQFVGRNEHGILGRTSTPVAVHADGKVGCRRCVIPKRKGAMLVEQRSH